MKGALGIAQQVIRETNIFREVPGPNGKVQLQFRATDLPERRPVLQRQVNEANQELARKGITDVVFTVGPVDAIAERAAVLARSLRAAAGDAAKVFVTPSTNLFGRTTYEVRVEAQISGTRRLAPGEGPRPRGELERRLTANGRSVPYTDLNGATPEARRALAAIKRTIANQADVKLTEVKDFNKTPATITGVRG